MKKRALTILISGALMMALCACGGEETASQDPASPPDLTGVWTQVDAEDGGSYQQAIISGDTITVNWVDPESTSLYWAGSFSAPTTAEEPYTWTSQNDTSKTAMALLASTSETKDFTYEDGKISYEVSALGTTTTVSLEKTGDAPAVVEDTSPDYEVTIDSATIETDQYTGESVAIVNLTFVNNSGETVSPDSVLLTQAFQDGVELDISLLVSDSYDMGSSSRDVQTGNTYEYQDAFVLTSDTSTIEISVSNTMDFGSDPIATKTFDPTTLA